MNCIRMLLSALLMGACLCAAAQESPVEKGKLEIAAWGGGGTGLGHSSSAQFLNAGLMVGKVLTGPHGPGLLRGDFEFGVDVMPLYLVFQDKPVPGRGMDRETVYGGAVSPLVFKWNFTRGRRVLPFADIEGTAIFTTREVPAGDTSLINFGSGLGSGLQFFRDEKHSFTAGAHLIHISNASLGNKNPSYNVTLQFRLAYQWWK